MHRLIILLVLLALSATAAQAQTVGGDRFTFNLGPQTLRNGAGAPEGVVSAAVGTVYFDNTTGQTYRKATGSSTTGWVLASGAGTVTSVAITGPTGLTWTGSPITTSGTFSGAIASGYFLPNGGTTGQVLRSFGASAPAWSTPTFPNTAGSGSFIRGDGTNWLPSTLTIPNTMTANRVLLTTATDTIGDDADLTFLTDTLSATKIASSTLTSGRVPVATTAGLLVDDADLTFATDTLSATKVAISSLTAGRVPFSSTAGLQVDDVDLTFATDTLTATKLIAPTSVTTPKVYAYGTSPSPLTLGGSGVAGCATNPPTTANCEAMTTTVSGPLTEQRMNVGTGGTGYRTQWFVNTDGAHVNAYGGSDWLPLRLAGKPVQIDGGGFHVGSTSIVDPGLGNSLLDGFVGGNGYVSQTTGWRVTADGAGDFRYLFTDEMHAKKFIADVEIALLGGVFVTKSQAKIAEAFTVPAKGSISVLIVKDISDTPDVAVFESGDTISLRQFSRVDGGLSITNAHGVVTSYTDLADGKQSWNFQRYLGADGGLMTDATVIAVDALALDFGVTGSGYYEINAADGLHAINSPYAQTVKWTGTAPIAANLTVTTRTGQLRGITGTSEYGILAGTYGATSAGSYFIASDQRVELHNLPLKLYNGSNVTLAMVPSTASFGQATSGADTMTFTSGNGCWSGVDAGVFKWRCGDIAGGTQFISWNGTQLQVAGNIVVTGTSIDASTVTGVAGATVVAGAALAQLGLNATTGNPTPQAFATAGVPPGTGLFLGSSHLGFFDGSVWKTYIAANGNFYLGGSSGSLQWNGSTLTITGVVNITSGSVPNASVTGLGALALLNTAALGSQTTGNYAGSTSVGGLATNTDAVGSQTAAQVQSAAIAANLGLASNGRFLNPAVAAPSGSGLFLGSDYMGFYSGGAWQSYTDSSGNFYLGGTGGALRWNASAGTLYINGNGVFSGALSAATGSFNSGTIGGFTLDATNIYAGSGATRVQMQVGGGFWAGADAQASAPFSVTAAGALTATSATLTGAFTTSGSNVVLNASGIKITPSTSYNDARAYSWSTLTIGGSAWGLYGSDNGTARTIATFNAAATNNLTDILLQTSNPSNTATVRLRADVSGGVSTVDFTASQVNVSAALVAVGNILTTGGLVGVTATTSNTGTVVVHAANGYYYDQSSSERFKHMWDQNWKPSAANRETFLRQPSALFSYIANPGDPVIGFSAEKWRDSALPFMLNLDKHGNVASYRQDAFLVYTHDVQQDHEARIVTLEKELASLRSHK